MSSMWCACACWPACAPCCLNLYPLPHDCSQDATAGAAAAPGSPATSHGSHVWLLRHAERVDETKEAEAWAAATHPDFHFDPPLTARGLRQASEAGAALAGMPHHIRAIYSSPQIRCLQTAMVVAKHLGMVRVFVWGRVRAVATVPRDESACCCACVSFDQQRAHSRAVTMHCCPPLPTPALFLHLAEGDHRGWPVPVCRVHRAGGAESSHAPVHPPPPRAP